MPTLTINGRNVQVDDSFLKLSPEQQNVTVDEIAKSIGANKTAPDIGPEIASGVTGAIKSAAQSVGDYLNPFSDARHASYARQAQAPLGEALRENLKQIAGTGAAIATPITAPAEVASAVATPLVAHPFAAANRALGVDIPYEQAKQQAGLALMGAQPRGFSPVGGRPIPAPAPTTGNLLKAGSDVYSDPAIKAIQIPPNDVAALASGAENDLLKQGFRPTPANAPSTFDEVKRLAPSPQVQSINVDDLRSARRALGIAAGQRDPFGKPTPDANAATQVIQRIDSFLDNVAPELRTANANYAAGKAAQQIDFRSMQAEHRAAKTGSGSNIENTMRQEVDKIKDRGLTPAQRAIRDQIVEGTTTRNALRKVGKLGFGDGLSLMYHAAAAVPTGGLSVPFAVAATGARKVGEALTRAQIRNLSESIRSGAPLALNQPAVMSTPSKLSKVIAAMLLARGSNPGFAALVPSYADQDQ